MLGEDAGCFFQKMRVSLHVGGGVAPRNEQACGFQLADFARDLLVLHRLAGLTLQAVQLAFELRGHVIEAGEVLFRGAELQFGLVAAGVQAGDAGGLFEDEAARLRLGVDDLRDLPLAHEGGRARARGGIGEEKLHVAGAHFAAVDAVGRAIVADDGAAHFEDFGIVEGGRGRTVLVGEGDQHFRHVAGGALGGAREDHVLHAGGAHGLV